MANIVSIIQTINQLRSRVVRLSVGIDENLNLYTEYYEYVEQLCYAFPIDRGLVILCCSYNCVGWLEDYLD